MDKAGIEPRNITYQALIDHLTTLEATETMSGQNKKEPQEAILKIRSEKTMRKVIPPPPYFYNL